MSFTSDVIKEALSLQIKKPCCKRAFTLGLFMGARTTDTPKELTVSFTDRDASEAAAEYLLKIFHSTADIKEQHRAGRIFHCMTFSSSKISDFLRLVDKGEDCMPHVAVGFKCDSCEAAFLRGVLIACASITDPKKSYHLEFGFPTEGRARLMERMIEHRLFRIGKIRRGAKYCLYSKNNGSIADILYYAGCARNGLLVTNSWIERDIRNNENRATNCVARNISRSVGAAQKQIIAIEQLIDTGKIEKLPEELRYTARLRVENDSASLSELAGIHVPPITKSGLNGRLKRIMEAAEDIE